MDDVDEFAQTRGADDLFDDEIIPVSAEEQQAQAVVVVPEPEPAPPKEEPVVEKQPSPRGETPQRSRGGDRDRGRGQARGRGRGKGGRGLQDSQWADKKPAENSRPKGPKNAKEPEVTKEPESTTPEKPQEDTKDQHGQDEEGPEENRIANGAELPRVPAVRGDRSATGGVRKPKLTEEELSRRIAAAKENAAKKAAAHARAEADQASFLEREQIAAEKRRMEAANRRVMDNEREQNRQRKLSAQTGREWDSQKREEDYNPRGGGSQFRRGMHGGVTGYVRRDFDDGRSDDGAGNHLSPGRGRGRGGRGGRGRGPRGDRASSKDPSERGHASTATPSVNSDAEFPSLSPGKKLELAPTPTVDRTSNAQATSMEKLEATMSPVSGTWADQVEE
ncbi:uncharacterized protein N7482_004188 [Penicillium canariense]|uniref:Uncharacterized protein n=1 Tax=Penicillium canariense TaxID=189055 RepID=A0A9W9LP47_9EURO|nr:uncharacterized protein N7482_004188 [Penicillium canariense]KAJ5168594.1 hypothetical protein N7482_004188 [Penicillium canariense]